MARLNYTLHRLNCIPAAYCYFPSGIREIVRFEFSHNSQLLRSEWAPLVGIHQIFIEEAIAQAQSLSPSAIEELFSLLNMEPRAELDSFFSRNFPYPLSFICSLALFYGYVQRGLWSFTKPISFSTLILPTHTLRDVKTFIAAGYQALKIKVGNVREDISRINAIKEITPSHIKVRLDANRRLNFFQAEELLNALSWIHYFEEPSFEIDRLAELHEKTGVDLALDESFVGSNDWSIFDKTRAQFFILKPSRFNNIFSVMNLIKNAQERGLKVILSPCFESDFYASLIEKLAQIMKLHDEPHGIYGHIFSTDSSR